MLSRISKTLAWERIGCLEWQTPFVPNLFRLKKNPIQIGKKDQSTAFSFYDWEEQLLYF
jgi:hypothetical protein